MRRQLRFCAIGKRVKRFLSDRKLSTFYQRIVLVLYNYTEKNKNTAPDDSAGCSVFGARDSEVLRKTDRKAVKVRINTLSALRC